MTGLCNSDLGSPGHLETAALHVEKMSLVPALAERRHILDQDEDEKRKAGRSWGWLKAREVMELVIHQLQRGCLGKPMQPP